MFDFDPEPASFNRHSEGGEMPTTYGLAKWLMDARDQGATHLIVVCDTWDHNDFPVIVMPDQDVREKEAELLSDENYQIMEVYWLEGDLDQQLGMHRSFTYGPDNAETE